MPGWGIQCTMDKINLPYLFLSFISSSSNSLAGPSLLSTGFASVLSDIANPRTPSPCVSPLGPPRRCLQVSRAKNEHLISLVDLLVHIGVEIFLHCVCDLERCSLYRYDQNQGQYLLSVWPSNIICRDEYKRHFSYWHNIVRPSTCIVHSLNLSVES